MALDLKANTAVDVLIGPFVDKLDGNTTEDGLTLTQAEIKLSKNGQTLAQKNDVTSAVFDDDGYYNCELDATDTNTEGSMVLIVHQSANALPVRHEFNVMSEAAWNSLYVAKDAGFMDVNLKTVGRADAQETEADNLESACSNYSATRGLTGTAVPAVAADGAFGLPISDAGGLDMDATDTAVAGIQTDLDNATDGLGALKALIDTADTAVDAIKAVTDALPDSGALTTIGTDTARLTAVRAAVLTDWIDGGRLDLLLDAVKAVTDALPDSGALTTIGTDAARLTAVRAAVLTDWINGGRLDLLIDAVATTAALAAAQTDLDTLTDAAGEPAQGAPPLSASLNDKVAWLYKAFRNKKTQTATQWNLYNDDTTTIDSKATVADDATTASKAEIVTGP